MVEFKVVCADPESGNSYQITVSGHHANSLVGKKVGDEIEGMFVELPGYKLQVTGGTDKDGFPMRPELATIGRKRIMVSHSKGFRPDHSGQRKKKTFRGNTISPEITQINMRVVERGNKPIEQLLEAAAGGGEEADEPEAGAQEPQEDAEAQAEEPEQAEAGSEDAGGEDAGADADEGADEADADDGDEDEEAA